MDINERSAFPADREYEFKKRMYKIRISKLERRINSLESRADVLGRQNEYYTELLTEKNLMIQQLRGVIQCLTDLLDEAVEELRK